MKWVSRVFSQIVACSITQNYFVEYHVMKPKWCWGYSFQAPNWWGIKLHSVALMSCSNGTWDNYIVASQLTTNCENHFINIGLQQQKIHLKKSTIYILWKIRTSALELVEDWGYFFFFFYCVRLDNPRTKNNRKTWNHHTLSIVLAFCRLLICTCTKWWKS